MIQTLDSAGQTLVLGMKVRDLIAMLENDGWRQVRMKGSHRQFQHACKHKTVTVAGGLGIDVPIRRCRSHVE